MITEIELLERYINENNDSTLVTNGINCMCFTLGILATGNENLIDLID